MKHFRSDDFLVKKNLRLLFQFLIITITRIKYKKIGLNSTLTNFR